MSGMPELTCTRNVNDGTWHHIAVVYDSNQKKRFLYIEGQQENYDNQSAALIISSESFVIGGRLDALYDDRGWDGKIDDVRLYNYALNPEEIELIYNNLPLDTGVPETICYKIPNGDLNQDCLVNCLDLSIIASKWLEN